ncbi:MAG: TRAP transporter small permease, partial [Pannonibacter phragmitetus]
PLGTPLALPQGLWFGGLVFMCLILALMLIRSSVALVTGDIETVKLVAGMRSTKEEAEEEAAQGERLIQGERK